MFDLTKRLKRLMAQKPEIGAYTQLYAGLQPDLDVHKPGSWGKLDVKNDVLHALTGSVCSCSARKACQRPGGSVRSRIVRAVLGMERGADQGVSVKSLTRLYCVNNERLFSNDRVHNKVRS
jgi:hypothetical protein